MCDWHEEDPHCHPNPVSRFEGYNRKNQRYVSKGGFCLDFTFHALPQFTALAWATPQLTAYCGFVNTDLPSTIGL
jgi:hypothetical protein